MSYWIFAIPGLLLAVLASLLTQSTFRRYSRVRAMSGLTGAEAAAGAGCSRRTWCYYESGRSSPDAVALARLDKLGFDVLYIITGRRGETNRTARL